MCVDCANCNGQVLSDKCVLYSGPDVPLLGITEGMQLSEVEAALIDKLQKALDGSGITLPSLTIGCSALTTLLGGADKTLSNILQVLLTSNCTLHAAVTALQSSGASVAFDTACLTVPANPSKDQILQASIQKICAMAADLSAIKADYVKASQLTALIQQVLQNQTTTTVVQQYSKFVPYVAYPYFGPLSNFDASGKGLASLGFDKVYLCNGLNGTPDARGRTLVGAVAGVQGAALDSSVDPSQNPGSNWSLKQKFGEGAVKLSTSQLPPHSHGVIDPGHDHGYEGLQDAGHPAGSKDTNRRTPISKKTDKAFTGITIGLTGSGEAHNNYQPSLACYFIMYLP
jgi:microcystin-dependent protein